MTDEALLIGEVAARAEVNVQTLRYYERRGLVTAPRRSAAGRRLYSSDAVRLVQFIKRAQGLGFSLDEIAELIRLRKVRGRQRGNVRRLAAGKLASVHEKLGRLRAMERALSQLLEACECSDGEFHSPILEALEDDPRQIEKGG